MCLVKACFGPFGDSDIFRCKIGAWFALNVPRAWKSFRAQLMVLLGDFGQVEAHFGLFGIVLISTEDRCTVCAECTIGFEMALGTPKGTPR
jgi:hypothetical protein